MRILYGVSSGGTALSFLSGQMSRVAHNGHIVALACPDNTNGELAEFCEKEHATFLPFQIERRPSPISDIKGFLSALSITWRFRPDLVVVGTPKASLLLLIASALLRVKHRVYLCHGLRFEGMQGNGRRVAILLERFFCLLSTVVVPVSSSVSHGLQRIGVSGYQMRLIGSGSPNGINTRVFRPVPLPLRSELRSRLQMCNPRGEVLFVGRLTHDKGLKHLVKLAASMRSANFTIVGTEEPANATDVELIKSLKRFSNVRVLGARLNVHEYMQAADILVLPSVREGMPTVLLEAAACGLASITMDATGTTEAVLKCESGSVVRQGDTDEFIDACVGLLDNDVARRRIRSTAPALASRQFDNEVIWDEWMKFIESL